VVSNGAKQVIFNALRGHARCGRRGGGARAVLAVFPGHRAVNDGTPVIVPVDESTAFKLTPPVLEAAITRTRAG
jgi:aspartate/methionine/tyrosine aminotransferase